MMIRNIFKQILNRKKSNGWIALALLLVFCLTWFTVDYFFVLSYNKHLKSYRDLSNTYYINIASLSKKNTEYKEAENEPANELANFYRIINRLKEHPDIESIALCTSTSSLPGTGSYSGTTYRNPEDTTRIAGIQSITIIPEEDYFNVFRHTKEEGKAFVSMNDYDWGDPAAVIVTKKVADQLFPREQAIGKTIETNYKHPDNPRGQNRIMGIIDDLKKDNYSRPHGFIFFPQKLGEKNYTYAHIGIRTKENIPVNHFIRNFKKEMSSKLRIGNYYLKNVQSFVQMEKNTDYSSGIPNLIRTRSALMVFFLINIALCILGVFWYRVNMRREEIGIRRAMGSDATHIRTLFIIEGLLLLTIIVPIAMLIEMQFIQAGLIETLGKSPMSYGNYLPDHTIIRFLITNGITWLLIAGMVILAIWYPAHSASRIKPVEALRDE